MLKKMVLPGCVNIISASQDDGGGGLITALAFLLTEHLLPEEPN